MEQTVEIAGQTVSIHYSGNTLVSYDPIVYLHSLKGNGSEVWGAVPIAELPILYSDIYPDPQLEQLPNALEMRGSFRRR